MSKPSKAVGILVAGTGINLTIGFLYAWSVFKKAMVADWGWTHSEANAAYTVAIVTWAAALLVAGVVQDRIGPRRVIQIGVFLVGSGLIASSFFQTPFAMIVTVGVIVATGIGFAYGCVTPMAMKWFHPSMKGMVSGITVAGFGVAAVYLAPLTSALIRNFGISRSFLILGVGILAVAQPLSFFVNNPKTGYVPEAPALAAGRNRRKKLDGYNYTWRQMVKTPAFYLLWLMFALSSSAGVMMIGHLASIATTQANIPNSAYIVSLLAISNASGRVGGGMLSDRIGRRNTMLIVFSTQLLNMLAFSFYTTEPLIILGTVVAGFSYGSLMSTFPSITSDNFGMKSYGANYGVLYTAWGVSGVLGPLIAGWAIDATDSYSLAYIVSAALLGAAIALGLFLKPVHTAPAGTDDEPATPATA
ncbi:MAG: OFA family MFS transporter [Spirochaetes bacterium]|nr:OFA family MFS transporter [Spirochaetota bacterium]MBU1081563.1 OFA family MFS transporter [Spirochaetota bacterium]